MKLYFGSRGSACFIAISALLLLSLNLQSCRPSQVEFKQIKSAQKEVLGLDGSGPRIIEYAIVYNAKAQGTVIVTLEDESEYQAEKLDGGQVTAVLTLINNGAKFSKGEFTLSGHK